MARREVPDCILMSAFLNGYLGVGRWNDGTWGAMTWRLGRIDGLPSASAALAWATEVLENEGAAVEQQREQALAEWAAERRARREVA